METKSQIRDLIVKNKFFEAIRLLYPELKSLKDKNALMTIEGRYNDLQNRDSLGILSEQDKNIETNKIRANLLELFQKAYPVNPPLQRQRRKTILLISIFICIALVAFVIFKFLIPQPKQCLDRKIAVLVANFQNTQTENERDGFANTLVTRMDHYLEDSLYDVLPVGAQTRELRRYDDVIKKTHFESSCDTSGLFINGFLSVKDKVFNVYITLVNLAFQIPELANNNNSILLENPSGLEFSIAKDAAFLADFLLAVLMIYEGKTYEALEQFVALEKNKQNIIEEDKNVRAGIAFFKGNCFALRGDRDRAHKQYDLARKNGNFEIKKAATKNKVIANNINEGMNEDPELRKQIEKNKQEHSKFEKELIKFFKSLGKNIKNLKIFQ